jgi:hypothetical protein
MDATVRVRTVHYREAEELLVYIEIACADCGAYTLVLHGHHLRPLVEVLQRVVDEAPDRLTDAGEVMMLPAETWHPESN